MEHNLFLVNAFWWFGRIFHHKGYSVIKKGTIQRIRRRFSSLENFQFFLGRFNFLEIKNIIANLKMQYKTWDQLLESEYSSCRGQTLTPCTTPPQIN